MFGWRGKIGLIVPSTNTVMEAECWQLAPEGVSVHTARMNHDLSLPPAERLPRMAQHACQAARDLASARVNAIVYGCTSGSFFFGAQWEAEHMSELADAAGKPVVSTSTAVVEAMRALGLRRVCVATPYDDELDAQLAPYLAEHGIEVLAMDSARESTPARLTPERAFRLVRDIWRPEADGLFFSCTGVPLLEMIAAFEEDLGKPVVTSNQASWWAGLGRAGIRHRATGFGRLLELDPVAFRHSDLPPVCHSERSEESVP